MKVDNLTIKVFDTRKEMGTVAAKEISECLIDLLQKKTIVRMIFAAAPSQSDTLTELFANNNIDWGRVEAFHMDEYIDTKEEKSTFKYFLKNFFERVSLKSTQYITVGDDIEQSCESYANLLSKNPIDIVIMGIGENGHIAFNDPDVADFNDSKAVKVVTLDEDCRKQQVNDGCFKTLEEVPKQAITLTIPTLMNVDYKFCIVPTKGKSQAVYNMLKSDINETCPASILRNFENTKLYLDKDSYSLVAQSS